MTAPGHLLQLHGVIVDLTYRVREVPMAGDEALVSGFSMVPGGGFNAMVAARRWGARVTYAGGLGSGPLGDLVARGLEAQGIPNLIPRDPAHDQGCCTVLVDDDGERTFIAAEGAEGHLAIGVLEGLPVDAFGWRILSGYGLHYAGAREALGVWLAGGTPAPGLVFDPSPVVAALDVRLVRLALARAAWVSANALEAAVLTGEGDPERAAQVLADGRVDGGAVVRDGARGAVIAMDQRTLRIPAHPVRPVDTTGAGDTHLGTFVAALAEGRAPEDAAWIANVAAALSTTQAGPATAPDRTSVERITSRPPDRTGDRPHVIQAER